MGNESVEALSTEEALKSAREANKVLMDCLMALNDAILARDSYIEFLTSSGMFTVANVHAADSLASTVTYHTNRAYSSLPIKDLIPPKYRHLFGTKHEARPVVVNTPVPPQSPKPSVPQVVPQDVTSDAFNAKELVLKFHYDDSGAMANATTSCILSWYNTYLTTAVNKLTQEKIATHSDQIGISRDIFTREGFIEQLKTFTRQFANQTNTKVRLTLPDGASTLIVPMTGLV